MLLDMWKLTAMPVVPSWTAAWHGNGGSATLCLPPAGEQWADSHPGRRWPLSDSSHGAQKKARYARGDWGKHGQYDQIELMDDERRRGWEATEDSGEINKSNVLNRRVRIISEYATARRGRLWFVSDQDDVWGRRCSCRKTINFRSAGRSTKPRANRPMGS
jgi:hypothetical protein